MRRSLLVLTLLVSVIFIGTAGASSASAANCQFAFSDVYYANQVWQWNAQAYNCTDVNAVDFRSAPSTICCYMVDTSRGNTVHFSYAGGATRYSPNYPVTYPNYDTWYYNTVWGNGCGAPPMYIYKHFEARIHQYSWGTWGPWHAYSSQIQGLC
jgi:hypothetical protein